nr:hypothetical protein [Tanacetum cinerariifolium]
MRRRHVAPVSEKDEDATLVMRLQREKFIGAYGWSQQLQEVQQQHGRSYVTTTMVNMRAMASRAVKWLIFKLNKFRFLKQALKGTGLVKKSTREKSIDASLKPKRKWRECEVSTNTHTKKARPQDPEEIATAKAMNNIVTAN